ncbi:MAG: hypothetical protein CMC82_04180 [Flavobacteriaceae bacterium]|nr:hypothetical protein [Flavobacteriaceae bacterium]|tara:strand:+ start:1276 stop:1542 length:267 start_codon:yes stop_codon:yes gene_type:complete
MNYILPFLAIALGALFVLIGNSALRKQLPLLLTFNGVFLLATTITAIFPEVFVHGNGHVSYWVSVYRGTNSPRKPSQGCWAWTYPYAW